MTSDERPFRTFVCFTCNEPVLRFFLRDGQVMYGYSGAAAYAHPDVDPGTVHQKVWTVWNATDDLATGPEWLEVVCKCGARDSTHYDVELGAALDYAKSATSPRVNIADVTAHR